MIPSNSTFYIGHGGQNHKPIRTQLLKKGLLLLRFSMCPYRSRFIRAIDSGIVTNTFPKIPVSRALQNIAAAQIHRPPQQPTQDLFAGQQHTLVASHVAQLL